MLNILYIELFKLKSSKMLWLIVVGAGVGNLFTWWAAFYSLGTENPLPIEAVMVNIELLMNLVIAPLVFYLFTGFIVGREYQEKTINHLYTSPYPRRLFAIGKLLTMLWIIVITCLLTYVFMIVGALFYHSQDVTMDLITRHLLIYGQMMIAHFALVPIAFTVSYIWKSYLAPMILAFLIMVVSVSVISSGSTYKFLFPWTAPLYLNGLVVTDATYVHVGLIYLSLSVIFLLPLLFNLYYVEKSDVHSGS